MSMYYSDNPQADADRYARDLARKEQAYPSCMWCGEPIYPGDQDEEHPNLCPYCLEELAIGRRE